ncbi:MAG: DUF11 domain-containing protein, partial [Verrucomicrobiota bacterium]
DAAANVMVTNRLASSVVFVSALASQGTASIVAGVVTSALGSIAPGESASIVITVTPSVAGLITNLANVVSASSDSNLSNNSASLVSSVVNPFASVVASGLALLAEGTPGNGGIDAGETVTVSLALANVGTLNTTNLVATLLASGGVTSPSAPQNYGVLVFDGAAVSHPFTFTASPGSTGIITATLQLQDGARNLGNVVFTFDLPQLTNFLNSTALSIPNSGPATAYPSTIVVSNLNGLVSKVAVTLNGLSHSFPDDLDILLVGPAGQKVVLMSDAGGAYAVANVNLKFDDAGVALSDAAQILSGTFRPTDYESGESLPPPAPPAPYVTSFTILNGTSPNGVWSLYVNDDSAGDSGSISGGWTLALTTVNTVNPAANLSVSVTDSPRPVYTAGNLTYSIVVSNGGPSTATGVVVNDTLPAGLTATARFSSQGSSVLAGGSVIFSLGTIESGSSATATLVVTPTTGGNAINSVVLTANETDLFLNDNTAQTTTLVLIAAPATLSSAAVLPNGDFQLTLSGQAGLSYRIEVSSNLISWTPLSTITAEANGTFRFTDAAARSFDTRFYRAVQIP